MFVVSASRPLNFDVRPAPSHGNTSATGPESVHYGFDSQTDSLANEGDCRAISTLTATIRSHELSPKLNTAEHEALTRSLNQLEILKRRTVFQKFPAMRDKYDDWLKEAAVNPTFFDHLSSQQRSDFETVRSLMDGTYLEEVRK